MLLKFRKVRDIPNVVSNTVIVCIRVIHFITTPPSACAPPLRMFIIGTGKDVRGGAADVAKQRQTSRVSSRLGDGKGNTEHGVGTEARLVRGSVEIDHYLIDVDLPELPHPEAPRARRGRPGQGYPRSDRHGQLPGREEGHAGHRATGRRSGDRARAHHSGGWRKPEQEIDRLSNIIKAFNDQFGGLFNDPNAVEKRIMDVIPPKVSADPAYQNARKNSDRQNARIEHDKALKRVITAMFKDDAQLFKQFQDNRDLIRRWLTETMFGMTYEQ